MVDTGGEPIDGDDRQGCGCSPSSPSRPRVAGRRTLVLRFRTTPVRIVGDEQVTGVEVDPRRRAPRSIACGLVLRAIGYHGEPVAGPARTTPPPAPCPTTAAASRPGVYVAGWVKRGPTGFIGTNKSCAQETVERMLDDLDAGRCPHPTRTRERSAPSTLESRGVTPIDAAGWRAIDHEERRRGHAARPAAAQARRPRRAAPGGAAMGALAARLQFCTQTKAEAGLRCRPPSAAVPTDGSCGGTSTTRRGGSTILDAAIAVLEDAEPGEDIHVQQIAQRAGLSRTVVYRHFTDRADLDHAVQAAILEMLAGELLPEVTLDGTIERDHPAASSAPTCDWTVAHPSLHRFAEHDVPGASGSSALEVAVVQIAGQVEELITVGAEQLGVELDDDDADCARPAGLRAGRRGVQRRPAAGWPARSGGPTPTTFVRAGQRLGLAHHRRARPTARHRARPARQRRGAVRTPPRTGRPARERRRSPGRRGRARRPRPAVDAAPDGLHPRREQAGRREHGGVPVLPGAADGRRRRAGRAPGRARVRRAQPLSLLARPPDGLPLPARRRLHRHHRRRGGRDRRPHPRRRCG